MTAAITSTVMHGRVITDGTGSRKAAITCVWLPNDPAAVVVSARHGDGDTTEWWLDRETLVEFLGGPAATRVLELAGTTLIRSRNNIGCMAGNVCASMPQLPVVRFLNATIDACPLGTEAYDLDAELSELLGGAL